MEDAGGLLLSETRRGSGHNRSHDRHLRIEMHYEPSEIREDIWDDVLVDLVIEGIGEFGRK